MPRSEMHIVWYSQTNRGIQHGSKFIFCFKKQQNLPFIEKFTGKVVFDGLSLLVSSARNLISQLFVCSCTYAHIIVSKKGYFLPLIIFLKSFFLLHSFRDILHSYNKLLAARNLPRLFSRCARHISLCLCFGARFHQSVVAREQSHCK